MNGTELDRIRKLGDACKRKGCMCLARCYGVFNRYWVEKASCCTHPNWVPADNEWWGSQPPLNGSSKHTPPKRTQSQLMV